MLLSFYFAPNINLKKVLSSFKIKKGELYKKYIFNIKRYFYSKLFT